MIVNSENIEFGYELISVLPHAYSLHLQGKLKGTVSGNDTDCLYYFSPKHSINKEERSWFNTPKVNTPNINIHKNYLDKKDWTPPPLKEQYKNDRFQFDKELLVITNRHNIEWEDRPINFFNEETLKELFDLLKNKYQLVYINIEGRPELYDYSKPIPLKDFELLKEYPEIINIHDLHKDNSDLSFNTLQLMLFANCKKYVTLNGGHAILAAYFGGESIIMSKYGKPQTKEILPQVNSFYRWYKDFSGQRVMHVENEKKLIEKVKTCYVNKEPIVNIIVRTSGRKRYFDTCIKSIQAQDYNNINIWVTIDNNDKYPIKYPVYPIYIDYAEISNLRERKENDGVFFHYNHYINIVQREINEGLIMYLDDDDQYNNSQVISKIVNEYKKGNELIFWRGKIGEKVFPTDDRWEKEPEIFKMSGFCFGFDSKYKKFADWRPYKRADYYCAKSLYENINKKGWINEILASTQNGSHAGMRVDKPEPNNNEVMKRNYVKVKILKDRIGTYKLKYKIGEEVEMSEAKAKQFILNGIAKEIGKAKPRKAQPGRVIKTKVKK